jgi:hypothetical protein
VLATALSLVAWGIAELLSDSIAVVLVIAAVVLTVIEAEISWQVIGRRDLPRRRKRAIRLGEILAAFTVVKVAHLVFLFPAGAADEIAGWPTGFFDVESIFVWAIAVGAWLFATASISDLDRLGDPREKSDNYRPPLQSLTARFLIGGVVLVAVGVFAVVGLSEITDPLRPPAGTWFWPAALYFMLGFGALGLIRLQDVERQWKREGMQVGADVLPRWRAALGSVVATAAAIALAVPLFRGRRLLGFAFGRTLGFAAWVADRAGIQISLRPRATGGLVGGSPAGGRLPITVPPEAVDPSSLSSGLVDFLTGLLFFGVIALLVVVAVNQAARRAPPVDGLHSHGVVKGLFRMLWLALTALPRLVVWAARGLWAWFGRVRVSGADVSQPADGGGELPSELSTGWRTEDPHRRQVAVIYRRFLDVAAGALLPRHRSETPSEYGAHITKIVRSTKDEVHVLTAGFNEARYSRHEIGSGDVRRVGDALVAFQDRLAREEEHSSVEEGQAPKPSTDHAEP